MLQTLATIGSKTLNSIYMELGVHHILGWKVICTNDDNMLKLTLLNLAMKMLPWVYAKARLSLYVNDLPNCVNKLLGRSFADDTNLFFSSDNLKQRESLTNQELKQIYN